MSLHHNVFKEIDEEILMQLVGSAHETKTLEFKVDLQLVTDQQKQEFMCDVTALANSDGGDLVVGMKEAEGIATELVGLQNFALDDRLGQIENLLRDFVQPRLMGVQMKAIKLSNGHHVLLIRVGRSFASPHMVRHKGITRFCGRNSNGKYDLDVQELRSMFVANETVSERLRNFRLDRINKLVSGLTPVQLSSSNLMVLHLLPLSSVRPDVRLNSAEFASVETGLLKPPGSSGWGHSFNMEGYLVATSLGNNAYLGYVQLFRNGFLEAVQSEMLNSAHAGGKAIPSAVFEYCLWNAFGRYLKVLEKLQLPPPYIACLSFLNVRDYHMAVGARNWSHGAKAVDRDHLLTDEILIENTNESPAKIIRPLFDQIWNACGWPQSLNYRNGEWISSDLQ